MEKHMEKTQIIFINKPLGCIVVLLYIKMYGKNIVEIIQIYCGHRHTALWMTLWPQSIYTVDDTVAPWGAFLSCVSSQELQLGAWPSLPQAAGSGFGSRTQRCWVWLTSQIQNTFKSANSVEPCFTRTQQRLSLLPTGTQQLQDLPPIMTQQHWAFPSLGPLANLSIL